MTDPRSSRDDSVDDFADHSADRHEWDITPSRIVYWAVIVEGSLLAVAIAGRWFLLPGRSLWGGNLSAGAWGAGFCAGGVLYLLARALKRLPGRTLLEFRSYIEQQIAPLFQRCSLPQLLLIAVLAGVGEEALFRGLVQQGIADWTPRTWGPWLGIVVGAALFGACHALGRTYFVLATLAGVYFGVTAYLTDSVVAAATAHATYDLAMLWHLTRAGRETAALRCGSG
jgi:membrane protease YdiL (CAAX protease family)